MERPLLVMTPSPFPNVRGRSELARVSISICGCQGECDSEDMNCSTSTNTSTVEDDEHEALQASVGLGIHPRKASKVQMTPKPKIRMNSSGTEKEHKPKLLSPDIFWRGRGLPREGVGAKKLSMSLETREIKLFGQDVPGFCWDIPAVPGYPGGARKV